MDLLKRLATFFGVSVGFLLEDTFTSDDAPAVQFFRKMEGLSEADLRVLRDMAARLKGNVKVDADLPMELAECGSPDRLPKVSLARHAEWKLPYPADRPRGQNRDRRD